MSLDPTIFLIIKAPNWTIAQQEAQKRSIEIEGDGYPADWDQIAAIARESNLLKIQQWYNEPNELGNNGYPVGTLLFFNRKGIQT